MCGKGAGTEIIVWLVFPCPASLAFLPAFCSAPGQKGPPEIPGREVGSTAGVTHGGKRYNPPDGTLPEVPTHLGTCSVFPAELLWVSWSHSLHVGAERESFLMEGV